MIRAFFLWINGRELLCSWGYLIFIHGDRLWVYPNCRYPYNSALKNPHRYGGDVFYCYPFSFCSKIKGENKGQNKPQNIKAE